MKGGESSLLCLCSFFFRFIVIQKRINLILLYVLDNVKIFLQMHITCALTVHSNYLQHGFSLQHISKNSTTSYFLYKISERYQEYYYFYNTSDLFSVLPYPDNRRKRLGFQVKISIIVNS